MLSPGVLYRDLDCLFGESLDCCNSIDIGDLNVVTREKSTESTFKLESCSGILQVKLIELVSE